MLYQELSEGLETEREREREGVTCAGERVISRIERISANPKMPSLLGRMKNAVGALSLPIVSDDGKQYRDFVLYHTLKPHPTSYKIFHKKKYKTKNTRKNSS